MVMFPLSVSNTKTNSSAILLKTKGDRFTTVSFYLLSEFHSYFHFSRWSINSSADIASILEKANNRLPKSLNEAPI